jgi:predicted amidohydrolase YtcJ
MFRTSKPRVRVPGWPVDLVLLNATVRTMDGAQPATQAVAVSGNRIAAVGTTAEVRRLAGPRTQVMDARRRLVLPGFNDAHVHFLLGGFSLSSVNLRDARSPEEFVRRITAFARKTPRGRWVLGGDWDHERWPGTPLPTKEMVDAQTPDHPVFVHRLDVHMALANSRALRLAGVTRRTKSPPGGLIVRDARGEPTGLLKDAAMTLVERVIPPRSLAEKLEAARAATRHAARLGVTSVQDMLANDDVGVFEALLERGELLTRIYACRTITEWQKQAEDLRHRRAGVPLALACPERAKPPCRATASGLAAPVAGGTPTLRCDMLRLGGVKGFADGSLGSATALFFEPYTDDPENGGLLFSEMLPEGAMLRRVLGADRAGLQVLIHAIGDAANWRILELYRRVAERNGPRDRRFRIEHAQHLRASEVPRFAAQQVIASVQPYHAIGDGCWCAARLGRDRARLTYAFRSLLDAGATLAFGSDWTVAPLNPLAGIYAAVTRRTLDGRHPRGWIPEQKISVEEAVRAYTTGSASAEFAEHAKGTITPGKLADLVMLDRDIFQIDPAAIAGAKVVLTLVDGKVVHPAS